jgi:hypothetical protein
MRDILKMRTIKNLYEYISPVMSQNEKPGIILLQHELSFK